MVAVCGCWLWWGVGGVVCVVCGGSNGSRWFIGFWLVPGVPGGSLDSG